MDEARLRIGEVAGATGVSVRSLRHYDEVGLLAPSDRSEAGYRLYSTADLERLYRVVALRRLGLGLGEISAALDGDAAEIRDAIRDHLGRVERELVLQRRLRDRLTELLDQFERGSEPSADQLMQTIEVMTMSERYYTPEQLQQLEERRHELGDDAIRDAEREWAELIAAVERERAAGTDPADPRVQELAARWRELIEAFTGGDPGIRDSLKRMYSEEGPERASRGALSADLMEYVGRAHAAAD